MLLLVRVIGLGPAAAGLLLAVSGFGGIGGALAAGAIAAAVGVRAALWVLLTCFALSAALLATPAIRSARDLPRQPAAVLSLAGR